MSSGPRHSNFRYSQMMHFYLQILSEFFNLFLNPRLLLLLPASNRYKTGYAALCLIVFTKESLIKQTEQGYVPILKVPLSDLPSSVCPRQGGFNSSHTTIPVCAGRVRGRLLTHTGTPEAGKILCTSLLFNLRVRVTAEKQDSS